MPLSSPFFRDKVKRFLEANGLRMESLDSYYAIEDHDGAIVAGAGIAGNVLKCLAVAPEVRSEGLLVPLVSRILSEHAGLSLKVFTKPEYQAVFESLGFRLLASAPLAVLMEKGHGLEDYCAYLRSFRRDGRCGVVVMNANPFTLGHRYLLEQASEQVDHLFVIPVKEDVSMFSYEERRAMICAGIASCHSEPGEESVSAGPAAEGIYFSQGFAKNQIPSAIANPSHNSNYVDEGPSANENYFSQGFAKNQFSPAIATPSHKEECHSERSEESNRIIVLEGSDYVISAATFPTYFLKDLSTAAETQMRLDVDLYDKWIAPALGATVRFVGSEPLDALTNRYNQLITNPTLVERLSIHGEVVSASRVRRALEKGCFQEAASLCPASTRPYLLAALAHRALLLELDTPHKPGLVCPESAGAHRDMDYSTMRRGIDALRPWWSRMALAASAQELIALGIDAEKEMLASTGGVNTHRGAIFCMGITLNALGAWREGVDNKEVVRKRIVEISKAILRYQLKDSELAPRGARAMAADGYRQVFEDWLPYYRSGAGELKTLLRMMSTLDDTCVVHRVGPERAQEVKREADEILRCAQNDKLMEMCNRYAAEGISPGGAADMLALTIFISYTNL
ncbi:MAG: triphosphoribosyl-dephospho-CoA synthase [Bacteroidales bacterium]|nr:triphosphoribosyl-dephospho-CoA synthase [Bacteroidales bacterium]